MSRDSIFGSVRKATARRATANAGIHLKSSLDLQYARLPEVLTEEFETRLTASGVCVERFSSAELIPAAVLRYLTAARLPLIIRHGSDQTMSGLPWHETPGLERRFGAAASDDRATLSRALSGIAETGTLLLASGACNPTTLNFMPDLHIVVIAAAHVVATMEEAFAVLDLNRLPRSVNLISGASRTGDIGGRLVMGAHGPRQLVVLITG